MAAIQSQRQAAFGMTIFLYDHSIVRSDMPKTPTHFFLANMPSDHFPYRKYVQGNFSHIIHLSTGRNIHVTGRIT